MSDEKLPWPLRYLVDEAGHDTGFAMLRGPILLDQVPDHVGAFEKMSGSHRMIGFTHSSTFPLFQKRPDRTLGNADPTAGWQLPEVQSCEAWCHCFREPERYLPPDKPRFLVSGSDWVDSGEVCRLARQGGRPGKRWDVVYCCISNWHNEVRKNWSLAKSCIEALVRESDLSVLLIGRAAIPDVPRSSNIDVRTNLPWSELLANTAASRMALLPNRFDPSPKVLAEAIALDVPVLVNSEILGGWKYINDATGVTFHDESDVVEGALDLLTSQRSPREWWVKRFGRDVSSRRLAHYLRTLGGADELEYAFPSDWLAP
jgi:hypothetical protein